MTIDLGTLPDWLAASGSILALGFAGWAAKAAGGQLGELKKETSDREQERVRAQAGRVAAWLEIGTNSPFIAVYINTSGLPIYEVTIGFISPNNDNELRYPVLPPADKPGELPSVSEWVNAAASQNPNLMRSWVAKSDVRAPFKELVRQADGTDKWEEVGVVGPIGLTITFTDMENRRWHRDLAGVLTRVDADFKVVRGGVL